MVSLVYLNKCHNKYTCTWSLSYCMIFPVRFSTSTDRNEIKFVRICLVLKIKTLMKLMYFENENVLTYIIRQIMHINNSNVSWRIRYGWYTSNFLGSNVEIKKIYSFEKVKLIICTIFYIYRKVLAENSKAPCQSNKFHTVSNFLKHIHNTCTYISN